MNVSFLNNLRVSVYEANKEKGFWDKPRNVAELFMLIVSELVEALETHRTGGRIAPNLNMFKVELAVTDFADAFRTYIKDSVADEIADAAIRTLDFCGGFNFELIDPELKLSVSENLGEALFEAEGKLRDAYIAYSSNYIPPIIALKLSVFLAHLYVIAAQYNIDLDAHILLKLDYNKTRSKKHGKNY